MDIYTTIDEDISFKRRVCDYIQPDDFLFIDKSDFTINDLFESKLKMEQFFGQVPKFSGLENECGMTFLRKFNNMCLLKDVTASAKIVALFDIHLSGPASIWYLSLPEETKTSWDNVKTAFNVKYNRELDAGQLQSVSAIFNSLILEDSIEVYFSKVQDIGEKLGKRNCELQARFISGLPAQLAFFVRARNPTDFESALTAAKLGDSFGYRGVSPRDPAAAATSAYMTGDSQADINTALQSTIAELSAAVRSLQQQQQQPQLYQQQQQPHQPVSSNRPLHPSSNRPLHPQPHHQQQFRPRYVTEQFRQPRFRPQHAPRQFNAPLRCYRCFMPGHRQRECGVRDLAGVFAYLKCERCSQRGHMADNCQGN